MTRVLITAFGPYDQWRENASWLALCELTRELPQSADLTTRLYPVDFDQLRIRLEEDHAEQHDVVLHLGQSPGRGVISLEAIGLNLAKQHADAPASPLVADGPLAYRSRLPLDLWAKLLRMQGIPAEVSFHAGTYLCNAAQYLTHHICEQQGRQVAAAFVHLPLAPEQVAATGCDMPSFTSADAARAVRLLLGALPSGETVV